MPSLVHHKSMNKAPTTSKQDLLARQTIFRRHCKQTYSCQIERRQTAYIEYILKCLLFGNAEVFISVVLHKLCSDLLTLPTQVSEILFKDKGSNGTILFYPCSKEPVKNGKYDAIGLIH